MKRKKKKGGEGRREGERSKWKLTRGPNTVGGEVFQFFHASAFLATFVDDVAEILPEICHLCGCPANRLASMSTTLHRRVRKERTHLLP